MTQKTMWNQREEKQNAWCGGEHQSDTLSAAAELLAADWASKVGEKI